MLLSLSCYLALLNSPDPAFLAGLANNPNLDAAFRRDCVLQLFRRHIKKGMTLSQVARLLNHPTWLGEERVGGFSDFGGFVPVNWNPIENSLYNIAVFPALGEDAAVVFLVVSGKPSANEGREVGRLLCGTGGEGHKDRVILDIGYNDPKERPKSKLPPLPSSGVHNRLSSASRDKAAEALCVMPGMTEADVQRLLGRASCCQQDAFGSIGSPVTISSTWFYSSGVCVMFCNGIVTSVSDPR
jgi:hypothetical protein